MPANVRIFRCPLRSAWVRLCCCLPLIISSADSSVQGEDHLPLHQRIDQLIPLPVEGFATESAAPDHEFLRRIFLDLAGRIPTSAEARSFLAAQSPDKRTQLIDDLLASSDYPRRMQELFHVMLMERRGEHEEWTKFLRTAFEQNLPWHQMAAAILKPDAHSEQLRGAAFFQTQRLVKEGAMAPVDVPGLTRDVGRLFAGIDLQCAQCHDHLTISDYSQQDFQGLYMVFENVDIRRDVKFPAIGEKLMREEKEYSSVFEQVAMKTGPVVPGGSEVKILTFVKDDEYAEPPDRARKTMGIPKFSPLKELSTGLASADNRLFCRNIVNRLWFTMMGRGLIEPLDLQHSENAATHPEVLELLADEFAGHDFNIRWLLKELALSRVYQRTSRLSEGTAIPPRSTYAVASEKRISAEQLFWSLGIATGEFDAVHLALKSKQTTVPAAEVNGESAPQSSAEGWSPEQLVEQSKPLQALYKQLQATFGNPPKEPEIDFTPTVAGALYLMHDDDISGLLSPEPGNLIHRLCQLETDEAVIEELYLSVFSRFPDAEEATQAEQYLTVNQTRKTEALTNLIWGMLTSTEFMVNH